MCRFAQRISLASSAHDRLQRSMRESQLRFGVRVGLVSGVRRWVVEGYFLVNTRLRRSVSRDIFYSSGGTIANNDARSTSPWKGNLRGRCEAT